MLTFNDLRQLHFWLTVLNYGCHALQEWNVKYLFIFETAYNLTKRGCNSIGAKVPESCCAGASEKVITFIIIIIIIIYYLFIIPLSLFTLLK